jgi:hypothetical protein
MSNEFVYIPLTSENFENVTSIPYSSSDPRCPLQPSALLKCICNEQMRKTMKDNIDKSLTEVKINPHPNYPMGCGDLSNYDLTPSRDCPVCSVEQKGSTITEPSTEPKNDFNVYSLRLLVLAASTREEKDAIIIINEKILKNEKKYSEELHQKNLDLQKQLDEIRKIKN